MPIEINESRLNHFYQAYLDPLFKWLNPQLRSPEAFGGTLLPDEVPNALWIVKGNHGQSSFASHSVEGPFWCRHKARSRCGESC